jgi:hypothetical protein
MEHLPQSLEARGLDLVCIVAKACWGVGKYCSRMYQSAGVEPDLTEASRSLQSKWKVYTMVNKAKQYNKTVPCPSLHLITLGIFGIELCHCLYKLIPLKAIRCTLTDDTKLFRDSFAVISPITILYACKIIV